MKTKQDLFFEIDTYFTSDEPGPMPESIRPFFEWLSFSDPNRPHSDAIMEAAKWVISEMSDAIDELQAHTHCARMSDNLVYYYELRAEIYQKMDQYYRSWREELRDLESSGGSDK